MSETEKQRDEIRQAVRDNYAAVADSNGAASCCGGGSAPVQEESGCCSGTWSGSGSVQLGYSAEDLAELPEGSDMALGCGNPGAIAALAPGETVVDLGSGGGIDCFLAAKRVGPDGRVIGVDMTPQMLAKARKNAADGGYKNVEFRLGEIEHLPIADGTVDVIMSNCVINLSPNKRSVLTDAYRVLAPGGRLAISDIVATQTMPEAVRNDLALLCGCISGAALVDDLKAIMAEAGFVDIQIDLKDASREFLDKWALGKSVGDYVCSATIQATKPKA